MSDDSVPSVPTDAIFETKFYAKSKRAKRRELVLARGANLSEVLQKTEAAWRKLTPREAAKWDIERGLSVGFYNHKGEWRWLVNPRAYADWQQQQQEAANKC